MGVLLTAAMIQLGGCSSYDPGNAPIEVVVESVEDLGVIDQDTNLRGRDGGYSGVHHNQSVFVFGDSVTQSSNTDGQNWFSNTWSAINDTDASDGLDTLMLGADTAGETIELLPFTKAEKDYNDRHVDGPNCIEPCGARWALWPGPLVSDPERNRSLLFYQKINARPGDLNFFGVGKSIAVWNYGDPHPIRPLINVSADDPTMMFFPGTPQPGTAALVDGELVYAFACTRESVDFECILARAQLAQATDPVAWQYARSSEDWKSDAGQAVVLFLGADIMSVSFNRYLNRYIAIYSAPLSKEIHLRSAPQLTGPWSSPILLTNALSSANTNGWVYDGMSHAQFDEQDGKIIYLTYTRDPGTNGWFGREVRLVRVQLAKPD